MKKRPKRHLRKLTIDEVETGSLRVVDEYGVERAHLWCMGGDGGDGGSVVAQFRDDQGAVRLELQVDPHGKPSVSLFGKANSQRISMAATEGGGQGITVYDHAGRPCITIAVPFPGADPRGDEPNIEVIDPETFRTWSVFPFLKPPAAHRESKREGGNGSSG